MKVLYNDDLNKAKKEVEAVTGKHQWQFKDGKWHNIGTTYYIFLGYLGLEICNIE